MNTKQSTHTNWNSLPTEDIQKYINKYNSSCAPGKCSSRRRKKIKFFNTMLAKREKTLRLLSGHSTPF